MANNPNQQGQEETLQGLEDFVQSTQKMINDLLLMLLQFGQNKINDLMEKKETKDMDESFNKLKDFTDEKKSDDPNAPMSDKEQQEAGELVKKVVESIGAFTGLKEVSQLGQPLDFSAPQSSKSPTPEPFKSTEPEVQPSTSPTPTPSPSDNFNPQGPGM